MHKSLADYDSQIHLYDKGHPDVHEVYRRFRQLLDEAGEDRPRVAIGEIHIFDWQEWVRYYGQELDEIHLPFNFTLLGAEWRAQEMRRLVDELEAVLPPGAWPTYVLGNHDESRIASRFDRDRARVAAMMLLTLRGSPTLYYGDEISMLDVPISRQMEQDPWGLRVPGMSRDPCRTPMQWSSAPNAGFSAVQVEDLWLPLHRNYPSVNVARQLEDLKSILNLYRALLAYRKSTPALQIGSYQPLDLVPSDCFVFYRRLEDTIIMVALNFSCRRQQVTLPNKRRGRIVLSSHLDREGPLNLAEFDLRADEGILVELDSL